MSGDNNYYNIFISQNQNFTLSQVIETKANVQSYPLNYMFDPSSTTNIMISKRTEAGNSGNVEEFDGIEIDDGGKLVKEFISSPPRRLEFLGDSITCGYGILTNSTNAPACSDPQGIVEDNWLTYGPLTSRYLNGNKYKTLCHYY